MFRILAIGLTIALFVLKLLGLFDHSWWYVFLPMIVYVVFAVVMIVSLLAIAVLTNK